MHRMRGPLPRFSHCAATAVMLVGGLVLTGWVLDISGLRGPIPGTVEMKANTAIGFVCAGGALWLAGVTGPRARLAVLMLASVPVALGALTLLEYALGANLGFDELLFRDRHLAHTVHPGRLAPQTAIDFVLLGLALMLGTSTRRRVRIAREAAALFALGLALFALLGYAYGVNGFNTVPAFTPIAVHTAGALVLLALGVAWVDRRGFVSRLLVDPGAGSAMVRRLVPVTFLALPLIGWLCIEGEKAGLFGEELGVALVVVAGLTGFAVGLAFTARGLNRADAALRAKTADATARLSDVVHASRDAIVIARPDGVIAGWNPAAEEIFGYSAEETIGRHAAMLAPPGHRGEAATIVEGALESRGFSDFETVRLRKDGRVIDVSISSWPLHDGSGEIVSVAAIIRDITARKAAEADLHRALARVRQATADLEASRAETIRRLARAVEHRDEETGAHVERMSRYCGVIARALGLSEGVCAVIETAAPMHDVGKISVPDAILFKPGPLTEEERAVIELHPAAGHRILAGSGAELLEMAATIALSHHERFDGSGYPRGLAGEEIPLAGRIAAVADVFDALTSDRVYRPAFSREKALEIMREGRGTHFDPTVLDAFFRVIAEQDAEVSWMQPAIGVSSRV